MKKQFFNNSQATKQATFLERQRLVDNHNKNLDNRKNRHEAEIKKYKKVLNDLIHEHFLQIMDDATPESIETILAAGDMKWKAICARVRHTNSLITLDINAFRHFLLNAIPKPKQ